MNANHDEYFLGVTLFMLIERMKNNCFYYFFNIKQVFAFKVVKVINLIIVIEFNPQYQTFMYVKKKKVKEPSSTSCMCPSHLQN